MAKVILQDAGLEAVWRECLEGCADALGPGEVLVRIVAAPETIVAESLGSALIDLQQRAGTLATVYADRINVLASRTGVNAATLLGRAIAHEIGHLLLGTARHSSAGLMRARWSDRELERPSRGRLDVFTGRRGGYWPRLWRSPKRWACSVMAHKSPIWRPRK